MRFVSLLCNVHGIHLALELVAIWCVFILFCCCLSVCNQEHFSVNAIWNNQKIRKFWMIEYGLLRFRKCNATNVLFKSIAECDWECVVFTLKFIGRRQRSSTICTPFYRNTKQAKGNRNLSEWDTVFIVNIE